MILFLSFLAPMAGDRFKSPVVTAVARRQLAFDGQSTYITSPIKAGQSILASPQKPVVQNPTSKNKSHIQYLFSDKKYNYVFF
jgi:hypothetical protein